MELVITLQQSQLIILQVRRVACQFGELFRHHLHLAFQIKVALGELFIVLGQAEEILQFRVPFIHLSRYSIGGCEIHTALIAVELKQQHHTDNLQKNEEKPVIVFRKERE